MCSSGMSVTRCSGAGRELGKGVLPHGAYRATDERAQFRPQLEEQVEVEVAEQVLAQALVQDGAVQAHALARVAHVVRGHPGPGDVQRQLDAPLGGAAQAVQ